MKDCIKVLLLLVAMVACNGITSAQNADKRRLTREELAEVQARHIAKEMSMDDTTRTRFVDTYCLYQKEIWSLGPRPGKKKQQASPETSDRETEEEIKARFDHSRKILAIREKYYGIYSRFLTQKQIERMYLLERRMINRLMKHKK